MNTPTELAGFIEYRLCQLRIQNLHHDFEHLCRDLARARIVSNILPATGPVAGKGDQGRDFETFRTYLAGSLRFSKGFIGLASEDTVVFACTVQHKDLTGKIKADVASICRQGTPVDRIYFLCTEAYNAADRHSVQEWAASEFQVKLEVLDGPVIAELLSEHEVFWIAKTYLHLPAELSPAPQPSTSTTPTWYQRLKGDWDQADRGITNFGELMQVVEGLRHATDNRDARTDLDSWLRLVEAFLSGVSDVDTAQRARYELSRATLRGTGDMRPAEHHVRSFFANVPSMTEPRDLQDQPRFFRGLAAAP